jgi:hypothetical protein
MSVSQQKMYAAALQALGVDSNGNVRGASSLEGVRMATQVAGQLLESGFVEASTKLRQLAVEASRRIPPPPTKDHIPLPPSLSPEMRERVQQTIQRERDPAKLQELISALKKLPVSSEGKIAIDTLSAMVAQIQAANITLQALEKTQETLKAPTGSLEPPPQPVPIQASSPPPAPSPPPPQPPPLPPPKTPAQIAAEKMTRHLRSVQSKYAFPAAKGREDKSIVIAFQKLTGLTADGLAGPGTLGKAASLGVGLLPLVHYWPRSSTRSSVQIYRNTLRRLASEAAHQRASKVAEDLRNAANRESGQSGIILAGPQLT